MDDNTIYQQLRKLLQLFLEGDETERCSDHRDIVVHLRGGNLKHISHLHQSYSTLHYTMLFPQGESGFHPKIPASQGGQSHNVSSHCYYAYRLHQRPNEPTTILRGGKLLQQYVVDTWASTEQSELNWIHHHQKELRAEVYQGLHDQAAQPDHDTNMAEVGQRIILPSSHTGVHIICISSFKTLWQFAYFAGSLTSF